MKTLIQTMRAGVVKTLGIIGLASGLSLGARAQEYQALLSSDGVVPIGGSNIVTFVATKGSVASFHVTAKLTGAGTSGLAVILEQSNDNSNWATTPVQFWRATTGATAFNHVTNFTLTAPFYRATIHNTNSVAVTNSTISVVVKQDYR